MLCKRTDKRKEFNSSVLLPRGLYSSKIFSVHLFIIVAFSSNHLSAIGSFPRKIGHFHRSRRRTSTCRRYWHNGARGFAFAHRGRLGYGIFLAYICFRFPISVNLSFFASLVHSRFLVHVFAVVVTPLPATLLHRLCKVATIEIHCKVIDALRIRHWSWIDGCRSYCSSHQGSATLAE